MRILPFLLVVSPGLLLAEPPKPVHEITGANAPDCYCTDRNHKRIELGQIICLQVDGRMFTARCEMSLNNPMWRELGEGCSTSVLDDPHATKTRPPAG